MIEQGIMDLAQILTVEALGAETLFRWHATGDGKSCTGEIAFACEPRDGLEKTLAEWQKLGLPGAGNLLCSIYSKSGMPKCRCDLALASEPREEPGVLDATEAVKAGRERASK